MKQDAKKCQASFAVLSLYSPLQSFSVFYFFTGMAKQKICCYACEHDPWVEGTGFGFVWLHWSDLPKDCPGALAPGISNCLRAGSPSF
jgi:hypothetical protein